MDGVSVTQALSPNALSVLGVGGAISIILIIVMYRTSMRLGETIQEFNKGQLEAARIVADSIRDVLSSVHEDRILLIRAMDQLSSKIDVLMERTAHTWEQVAIHRGVSEPPITGTAPVIVSPPQRSARSTTVDLESGSSV